MLLILLGSIVWPTTPIWQCKPYQDCLWWFGLKICCKPCIHTLPIHLKGTWSSQNLQNSCKQREIKSSRMWKPNGFLCWALPREWWQNTWLCWWRWPWIVLPMNKPSWIMRTCVISNLCLGLLASYHH
jgi:hypothetical protein